MINYLFVFYNWPIIWNKIYQNIGLTSLKSNSLKIDEIIIGVALYWWYFYFIQFKASQLILVQKFVRMILRQKLVWVDLPKVEFSNFCKYLNFVSIPLKIFHMSLINIGFKMGIYHTKILEKKSGSTLVSISYLEFDKFSFLWIK